MPRKKVSAWFLTALYFLLASLIIQPASAQEMPTLFRVFPQSGSQGTEAYLLLRGDGFESLGQLRGVLLRGQEIPVLESFPVSNQLIKTRILIPEQISTGEADISFLFENGRLEGFFFVTESGDQEAFPIFRQVEPLVGQVDSELALFVQGARLYELGEIGGVLIGDFEVPVIDYAVESDRSAMVSIYLPPETPVGATGISLFFDNYSLEEAFTVRRPGLVQPATPRLLNLTPREGLLDSDTALTLEGEGFFDLGDLVGVTIAGMEVPTLDYVIESNETMVVSIYLPPDLPTGDAQIAFFFENSAFESDFQVISPGILEPPVLLGISPPEVEAGSQVILSLEGERFSQAGRLQGVALAGEQVPLADHEIVSDQLVQARIFVPPETSTGNVDITFFFENAVLEGTLDVIPPGAGEFPWLWILIVCVAGVVGFAVGRGFPAKPPPHFPPEVSFIHDREPGSQSIEPADQSIKTDIDVRLEIETLEGEPSIQPRHDSIIKESRPLQTIWRKP